jgi:hypothetical protein
MLFPLVYDAKMRVTGKANKRKNTKNLGEKHGDNVVRWPLREGLKRGVKS